MTMLDWPDIVNGSFEILGMVAIGFSIVRLYHDKIVRGVSWFHVAFFASWGYWNLFYYWQLDQWMSWAGGIGVTVANTFWLCQLIYYSHREVKNE